MNQKITWIIVILVIALGAWFLLGRTSNAPTVTEPANTNSSNTSGTSDNQNPGTTPPDNTIGGSVNVNLGATKSFTVTGQNFSFTPSTLTVKKGDKVNITFKNTDGMHDFHIDEFNVATARIGSGQEQTVSFVADKAGSFQYYCSVGSHRAMGMWGTLKVTE